MMDNENPCKIVGIESIKICMQDCVMRTFYDVRRILDLKKNLVSMVALDASGLTYNVEDVVMHVYGKNNFMVK